MLDTLQRLCFRRGKGVEDMSSPGRKFSRVLPAALVGAALLLIAPRDAEAQSFGSMSFGSTAGWISIGAVVGVSLNIPVLVPNARRVAISRRSLGWGVVGIAVGALSLGAAGMLASASLPSNGNEFSTVMVILLGCTSATTLGLSIANLALPERRHPVGIVMAPMVVVSPSGTVLGVNLAGTTF